MGTEGDNSIIALDDIVMHDRPCPALGSCTFEDDYCYWTNTKVGDDMDWEMNQGSTPTQNTGPDYDHTLDTSLGMMTHTHIVIDLSNMCLIVICIYVSVILCGNFIPLLCADCILFLSVCLFPQATTCM